jgi:hypothetical protein
LREAGDVMLSESQCTRSRTRTKAAPESTRVDLLTSCVALHPANEHARSDITDFASYLPNLTPDEDALYRTYLQQRCMEKVSEAAGRCDEPCACETKNEGKPVSATCRRECSACRDEGAKRLQICKELGPPASPAAHPVHAARGKARPAKK